MFRLPNVHVLGVKQRVKKFAPNGCLQMVINDDIEILFAHPEALLSKEGRELMST